MQDIVEYLNNRENRLDYEINNKKNIDIQSVEKVKIIQNKNIRNGKPIIKGTRLTIMDVLFFMTEFVKEHEKEFKENYADINSKQIIASIDYLLENNIPKQKIKDTIKYYQKLQRNYIEKYDKINNILEAIINVLQGLLEGKDE